MDGKVPKIALPKYAYEDAFRPNGLDGTFLDGMEPVVGYPEPGGKVPPRRMCWECANLGEVDDGEGATTLFLCSYGIIKPLSFHEAQHIQVRCTEFEGRDEKPEAQWELEMETRDTSQLLQFDGGPEGVLAASTAVIDNMAEIGEGTRVWHYTVIGRGARIGRDCVIGSHVTIDRNTVIGDRCHIQNGARLYEGVVLEDDVFVGPNVTFTNDKHPRAHNPDFTPERTMVMRGASIGAGATILCGIVIGYGAVIGAGAVVTKSVDFTCTVKGVPAR